MHIHITRVHKTQFFHRWSFQHISIHKFIHYLHENTILTLKPLENFNNMFQIAKTYK